MSIPEHIEILHPWEIVHADDAEKLKAELQRELPAGHVLTGMNLTAVARRTDRDDLLFEVDGSLMPLAQVHLTWQKEKQPNWPHSRFYRN